MFKPVRIVATLVFLASIVLVFIGAFVINSDVRGSLHIPLRDAYSRLCPAAPVHQYVYTEFLRAKDILLTTSLVLVIVEYLAYTWYTLSYIPYARSAVLKIFGM